jgi:hypothetical protein
LHFGDEGFGFILGVDYCGYEADVFIDVGEGVGARVSTGSGFEDCGEDSMR